MLRFASNSCSTPYQPRGAAAAVGSCWRASTAAQRERQLLLAWRAGDSRAGARLLGSLHTMLLRYFGRLPPDLAEDLAQETLVACLRARDSLRDVRALRCYVYTVARRIRSRERSRSALATVEFVDDEVSHVGVERIDTARIDVERLLDPDSPHVRIVAEYYIGGLRAQEIADRRQVPLGTVRSRIRRGLLHLRRSVAE